MDLRDLANLSTPKRWRVPGINLSVPVAQVVGRKYSADGPRRPPAPTSI
jgi:hypothetical protein